MDFKIILLLPNGINLGLITFLQMQSITMKN